MRHFWVVTVAALAFCCLYTVGAEKAAGEKKDGGAHWIESLAQAQEEAKTANKPVLALFTGTDWCPYCVKLEKEVLSKPEFGDWAATNVILAKMDFPRKKKQTPDVKAANKAAAQKYRIGGFPTVLFLSAQGEIIGQMGYEQGGAAPWIQKAQTLLEKK
jgi:protein disulfide-isomerase